MKNLITLLFILIFFGCQDNNQNLVYNSSNEYLEITKNFSIDEFEAVKDFILQKGDRQTYSNIYNNNPHFSFEGFQTYLNPEIGQKNINCDPEISDFNELVIRDQNTDPQYYYILIVRQGDLQNKEIFNTVPEAIMEMNIYLLNPHGNDLEKMKVNVLKYINTLKEAVAD